MKLSREEKIWFIGSAICVPVWVLGIGVALFQVTWFGVLMTVTGFVAHMVLMVQLTRGKYSEE